MRLSNLVMFQVSARPSRVPWPHRPSAPRTSAGSAAPPSRTTRRPRHPPGGRARSHPAHRRCQRRHSHLSQRFRKDWKINWRLKSTTNQQMITNVNCSFSWMKYEAHECLMNDASWDSKTQLTSHPTAEKSNTMTIKTKEFDCEPHLEKEMPPASELPRALGTSTWPCP